MVKPKWDRSTKQDQAGQGLPEYALILGLIAVLVVAALTLIEDSVNDVLTTIANTL